MSFPLIATKFYIPPVRTDGVVRPRLIEKLLDGIDAPGTTVLLSGPAGFGKTTLLSELATRLTGTLAWVSLDAADNDPIRFWTYFITAFQSVRGGVGDSALAMLQAPQPLPDDAIPTLLVNDFARLDGRLALVLDDYHAIHNPSIHAALAFLLDHLPGGIHLVCSTRIDPPWPLARLRARNQLVEIRAADLRFTTEEATQFLTATMGLKLSPEDAAVLEARTEGWIAGLQLAAISMKNREDTSGFVKALTGSHVYVAEYLIEEVLRDQPAALQTFLLQTSILEPLNAGLCEAVTGRPGGRTTLMSLQRENLFMIPLDDEGQWFRYHHLFADLLKARLQQTLSREETTGLHRRAALWYEQAGMTNEAILHYLAAADPAHAVELVEKAAMPMILKAYFKTVEGWLQAIPPEYLRESPRANMAFAWMHLMRGNFAQVAPHLERLQAMFLAPEGQELDSSLQGQWLALQSMILNTQGKAVASRDLAEKALNILPDDEAQVRSMTYMGLTNAYLQMLDYERARGAAETIIQRGRAAGDLASEVFGFSFLGRMVLQQGQLHSAHEIASQALQRIEDTGSFSPFSATLYGELAQVYYYWHQLEEARAYFSRSVQWSALGGFSDAEIYHSVFLSRLFQMEGNLQASVQEIEKALELMRTAAPVFVREEVISQQVSIFLAVDRLAAAQMALLPYGFAFEDGFSYPELAADASIPHPVGLLYNSALRTLLHRAEAKHEQQALRRGIELADLLMAGSLRCRHLPIVLQTLLLRSRMNAVLGKEQAGLADLARALELAEPEGFISSFLEEGRPVAEAIRTLVKRNLLGTVQPDYVYSILAEFPGTVPGARTVQPTPPATKEDLIEPLTSREMEALQLIAAGDSNQAIADKLVITLSAVKKHTGNIFHKLNVNSRTQAVARARQLGLIEAG